MDATDLKYQGQIYTIRHTIHPVLPSSFDHASFNVPQDANIFAAPAAQNINPITPELSWKHKPFHTNLYLELLIGQPPTPSGHLADIIFPSRDSHIPVKLKIDGSKLNRLPVVNVEKLRHLIIFSALILQLRQEDKGKELSWWN
jgi:hypothetical protein